MKTTNYWCIVVSKDHALLGINGGFIQTCHGKKNPLNKIKNNDFIIIYSPKLCFKTKIKHQYFIAIGEVLDDTIYEFEMSEDFKPWRMNINFLDSKELNLFDVIDKLNFIKNKKFYGMYFRYGQFNIPKEDFELIKSKMINC